MTQQDCPRNFRALCVELVDAYAWCIDNYMSASPYEDSLVQRAHAALAQPEPGEPTDEDLWELYDQRSGEPEDWPWIRDYARAVLALCKK
jgi:hypothetical protein